MNLSPPLSVADKLALILDGLMRAVASRSSLSVLAGRGTEVLAGVLINLICGRVRQARNRILILLAKFQAGRLRVWRPGRKAGERKAKVREVSRAGAVKGGPQSAAKLPRRLAWLLPLVPCEAAGFAAQLRLALAEPDMVALLMASAQARRILAPVCRMLGIEAEVLTPVAMVEMEVVAKVVDAAQVALERAWNLGVVPRPGPSHGPPGDQGWRVALGP